MSGSNIAAAMMGLPDPGQGSGIPLASMMNVGVPTGNVPLMSLVAPNDPNRVTPADAYTSTTNALGDWIAAQRADAAARGLWNDTTGMPTQAGMLNAAQQYGGALVAGTGAPEAQGIRAFHGSPHDFDAFDASKIGTGEGAQAYGHGLYFAGNEGVAKSYRDALTPPVLNPEFRALQTEYNAASDASGRAMSGGTDAEFNAAIAARDAVRARLAGIPAVLPNPSAGHMYEVNINANPDHFLDWDKPLSEQSPIVQQKIAHLSTLGIAPRNPDPMMTGGQIYQELMHKGGSNANVAAHLAGPLPGSIPGDASVAGIRYLDGGSRVSGEGTSNHVVFDPATIEILRKYGLIGLLGGGTAAASTGGSQ